jgi:hypothetical protein
MALGVLYLKLSWKILREVILTRKEIQVDRDLEEI